MPANFRKLFILHGWEGIKAEVRAHRRSIKRWLLESGEEELQRARREYLEAKYAAEGKRVPGVLPGRKRAKRYVLGLTLSGPKRFRRLDQE